MSLKNKNSQKAKNLKAVNGTPELSATEKSKVRIAALTTNVFKAISETSDNVEGDITIFEITEALLVITRSYNKRFLDESNGLNDGEKN